MPRLIATLLVSAALTMSACGGSAPSAGVAEQAPLPTIGLGSEVRGVSGASEEITVGADVRLIGSTEIDTIVMIGDSITVGSTAALSEVYRQLGFQNVIIESMEGKRTVVGRESNPGGATLAEEVVEFIESEETDAGGGDPTDHSNELWVVALGTNDIGQYSDAAEWAAAVNEMLDAVPDESPLVWVDTYFRDRPDGTDEVNAVIESRVGQRGNSIVARWSSVADLDGNLRNDGVHPRDQGTIVFANTVGAAIVDFFDLA